MSSSPLYCKQKRSNYYYNEKWFKHHASKRHYIKIKGEPTRSVIMSIPPPPPPQKNVTTTKQNKAKLHSRSAITNISSDSIPIPSKKNIYIKGGGGGYSAAHVLAYLRSHAGEELDHYEWVNRNCLIGIQEI